MKTIKENVTIKYEINKSIFIASLFRVNNVEEVNNILSDIRKKYSDATHNTYAYIVDNHNKSSDDKEPSGTAGIPILEVLIKNELNNILCVVTRYFGGIKLGAGGLVRAYTKAAVTAVNEAIKVNLVDGFKIEITSSYNNQKTIEILLGNYKYEKKYTDDVTYISYVEDNFLNILDSKNIKYKILEKIKVEL